MSVSRRGRLPAAGPHPRPRQRRSTTCSASARRAGDPGRRRAATGDPAHFDAIGDDWDVEERAVAELARLGLPAVVLDRRLGELSGGEVVRLGLARLLLRRPDVLLLDEPTNNLDAAARQRLYDVVDSWTRTLLVVSHDRELLERMDRIGDLRDGAVRWYGGGFRAYADQVAAEQEAAAAGRRDRRGPTCAGSSATGSRPSGWPRAAQRARMCATARAEDRQGARHSRRTGQRSRPAKYRRVHEERLDGARDRLDDGRGAAARGPRRSGSTCPAPRCRAAAWC